jgi:hypothetical protein
MKIRKPLTFRSMAFQQVINHFPNLAVYDAPNTNKDALQKRLVPLARAKRNASW